MFFISFYGKGGGDDKSLHSFCLEDFQGPTILPPLGSFTAVNRRELVAPSLPVPLRDKYSFVLCPWKHNRLLERRQGVGVCQPASLCHQREGGEKGW